MSPAPDSDGPGTKIDGRTTRSTRTVSLVEDAQRRIFEDIIRGRLQPGTLIQLGPLADEYGVSRTPIREALKLLEREGVVQAIAYKGYLIRSVEPGDVRDVFFMRRLLEGSAAELAATRLQEPDLIKLREQQTPPGENLTLEHDKAFHDFHGVIMQASGSPRLVKAFETTYNDVRRLQYAGIGQSRRPDLIEQEHNAILERLEAKDPQGARARMEEHIDLMRTRALEAWVAGE